MQLTRDGRCLDIRFVPGRAPFSADGRTRVLDVETRVVRLGGVAHVARGPFAAASPDPSRVYLANTAEEVVDAWRHDCVGFEVRW